jgi:hypothetical protein
MQLAQAAAEAAETRKRNAELEVQAQKDALQLAGLQQTTAEQERQVRQAFLTCSEALHLRSARINS